MPRHMPWSTTRFTMRSTSSWESGIRRERDHAVHRRAAVIGDRSLSNFVTTVTRRLLQEERMAAYQKRVLKDGDDATPVQ